MLREKIDFPAAVLWLGGAIEPDPARAKEIEAAELARREKAKRDSEIFRERERRKAFDIWHQHQGSYLGTPVETYLREIRGLPILPDRLPLRYAPLIPFFHGEKVDNSGRAVLRVIHQGPAMLAPFTDAAGIFRAVHITWLDFDRPNGKAVITAPDTGEQLPSKKMRGSVAGNAIRLVNAADALALDLGEGVETVLSVWCALRRCARDLSRTSFWAAGDLGNMAAKSAEPVRHPTWKDGRGRTRRVPGPKPDLAAPSIIIPESVDDLVLLGDGDSDRFLTQCALARATARYSRAGRVVRTAWAPDGMDFNDIVRAA
jgi:hypothetical protein